MKKLLVKIRLSWFFVGFFVLYLALSFTIPATVIIAGSLSLFSVNSFLYGFYIGPVLNSQKTRIDDLAKAIRAESNALFDMLLRTKLLHKTTRNKLQDLFEAYIRACLKQRTAPEGEKEYEALISFCLQYKGEDKAEREKVEKILATLVTNQTNRSNLAMLLGNKVFSNEWLIMLVLFSITLGFILFLNVGDDWIMHFVKALLCTGLTMLMINLLKLSTLTHKKAKTLWDPMHKLMTSRFYRID